MINELEGLHQMHQQGALDPAEFQAAKAALLHSPAQELLKLDELRDSMTRLNRDWDEERRKYHPYPDPESIGVSLRTFKAMNIDLGLVAIVMAACLRNVGGLFVACGILVVVGMFQLLVRCLTRLRSNFTDARQTYEAHRMELEAELETLRGQLRGGAHGS
ncbi:MAG: hypothetical protein RL095_14 [Verrucomicrobiota bacterium]|jgi:hypothetical protein